MRGKKKKEKEKEKKKREKVEYESGARQSLAKGGEENTSENES